MAKQHGTRKKVARSRRRRQTPILPDERTQALMCAVIYVVLKILEHRGIVVQIGPVPFGR